MSKKNFRLISFGAKNCIVYGRTLPEYKTEKHKNRKPKIILLKKMENYLIN